MTVTPSQPIILLDGKVALFVGDVLAVLRTLPDESVDCVVTSPPYWGLRDYGVDGQLGLERSLSEHIAVMVEVFEEVKRILKPEGTLWLNYGDCYASTPNGKSAAAYKAEGTDDRTFRDKPFSTVGPICRGKRLERGSGRWGGGNTPSGPIYVEDFEKTSREGTSANKGSIAAAHGGRVVAGGYLKPKDLCMIPNRLAIALQDAGWWVRSEIIWAKPNPMPESVKDRPATSHEKIWLLTKSERYFYDHQAVRQGRVGDEDANGFRGGSYTENSASKRATAGNKKVPAGWAQGPGSHSAIDHNQGDRGKKREVPPRNVGYSNHTKLDETGRGNGRSLRNWEPAPASPDVWDMATSPFPGAHFATFPIALAKRCIEAGCPVGGVVLDPFGGAGTTAVAAHILGRRAQLVELNPEYADIATQRIAALGMGPEEKKRVSVKHAPDFGPLFSGEGSA